MDKDKENRTDRIPSIDCFRGLSIMLMVIVNYINGIQGIPAYLKHAPDIGLTVTDLVAPAFIFAIGLTYRLSFQKRIERDGAGKTYMYFLIRFLAITGIGAIYTAGAAIAEPSEAVGAWGVLQAIGAAGLITLPLIRTGTKTRLAAGLALLLAYQLLLDRFWLPQVLVSAHGGLYAALSWGSLLLLSTALGDLFHKAKGYRLPFAAASAAVLAVGLLSSLLFAVSKHRVSFSYVLISAGISGLVLFIFNAFLKRTGAQLTFFQWWGKNPMLLYILHIVLLGVTWLPGRETWYVSAPLWSAALQTATFFAALSVMAWKLDEKKVYFKI